MIGRLLMVVGCLMAGVGGMVMAQDGRPLEDLRWEKRVIVVLADTSDDPALVEQARRLREAASDLAERDVVQISATDDAVTIDGSTSDTLSAGRLRQAYASGTNGFQVVLIGKDGGVKLRAGEPVAAGDFFALIDTMPMRQRELREGAG